MTSLEIEYKWEANSPKDFDVMQSSALALSPGTARGAGRLVRITDYYLDGADGRFHHRKIAVRLRHYAGKWEATFKTKNTLKAGRAERTESVIPLPYVRNFKHALSALSALKKWEKISLENLELLFILSNKRRIKMLQLDPKTKAELVLDDCQISVLGRTLLMKEAELEYKAGSEKIFHAFAQVLTAKSGLLPARCSKVKTALALRFAIVGVK